jgi:Na+-translocating ferredoxin:NAD+ oxidoreductase subunit B
MAAHADAARIDALLPQTQCTRCGYAGCAPYAEAIERGEADINQCPPGGSETIESLALLLGRAPKPLNPDNGVESAPAVAVIDAERCIGCAKCLPPCPVDAILGAAKFLHTVISERCTGCELCIAPCPVDCISIVPAPVGHPANDATANRRRYTAHLGREAGRTAQRAAELAQKKSAMARAP